MPVKLNWRPKKKDPLIGIYREGKGDYGFIDSEKDGEKLGYYTHSMNKGQALDGDEVRFYLKNFKGKEEAVVQFIEKRAERIFVGTLEFTSKDFGFMIPDSQNLKQDIFITKSRSLGAKTGQKVAVRITSWKGKNPEGEVVEVLGSPGDKGMDVMSIALESGARTKFPQGVLDEAKLVSQMSNELVDKSRKDLIGLFTFTIDGEDAKDLDDAISLETLPGGNTKLFVHIADVTHYVGEKSLLDEEALKRGTSIYLADRVIPMLPEDLSNGVCSLSAGTQKLTLTCEMDVAPNGKIIGSRVYESMIQSNYRLTYKEVESICLEIGSQEPILDSQKIKQKSEKKVLLVKGENEEGGGEFAEIERKKNLLKEYLQDTILCEAIKNAYELKRKIESYRFKNGYLTFDFVEAKIIFDEEGKPIDIKKYEKLESHKVIEHFMISANEAVSRKYAGVPFLYRVHPNPDGEDLEKAIKAIGSYITLPEDPSFEEVLGKVSGNNSLSRILLRALPKAIYSAKNGGHFGLGLEFYSHFTSPIRRYPDLQIHRIIKQKLSGKLDHHKSIDYKKLLPEVAKSTSESEKKAEKIEREVEDLFKVKYMASRIGEEFIGTIVGMIAKGMFVELESTLEGFVSLEQIQTRFCGFKQGQFEFFEDSLEFINSKTGLSFRFGDQVKIRVKSVDEKMRRVDFEILEMIETGSQKGGEL